MAHQLVVATLIITWHQLSVDFACLGRCTQEACDLDVFLDSITWLQLQRGPSLTPGIMVLKYGWLSTLE